MISTAILFQIFAAFAIALAGGAIERLAGADA